MSQQFSLFDEQYPNTPSPKLPNQQYHPDTIPSEKRYLNHILLPELKSANTVTIVTSYASLSNLIELVARKDFSPHQFRLLLGLSLTFPIHFWVHHLIDLKVRRVSFGKNKATPSY